jgi:phospholipid transport system substrate-binding protein
MNRYLLAALFIFSSTFSFSKPSPFELIEGVGNSMFSEIKAVNSDGKASLSQMKTIVNTQLMPHVDTKFISFKLLGKHIKGIKRAQAKEFISAVEQYLITTYANALLKYKGQEIEFVQLPVAEGAQFASVKVIIKETSGPNIDLQFKFRKSKTHTWKVYDMVAEGISLLSAKQNEITQRISQVGLVQVSTELKAKSL